MKKIVSLFQRNYDGDRLVRDEVVPGAEWVLAGEGIPTRKHDGTCCLIREGVLYKRYEVKPGSTPPAGFEPATDVDPNTGKQQGWLRVGDGPEDKWFAAAFASGQDFSGNPLSDGTYELCGPKVQGNPEGYEHHVLVPHGCEPLEANPRSFDEIREFLAQQDIEGIVWHHADGRMVKIKARDFGIRR